MSTENSNQYPNISCSDNENTESVTLRISYLFFVLCALCVAMHSNQRMYSADCHSFAVREQRLFSTKFYSAVTSKIHSLIRTDWIPFLGRTNTWRVFHYSGIKQARVNHTKNWYSYRSRGVREFTNKHIQDK